MITPRLASSYRCEGLVNYVEQRFFGNDKVCKALEMETSCKCKSWTIVTVWNSTTNFVHLNLQQTYMNTSVENFQQELKFGSFKNSMAIFMIICIGIWYFKSLENLKFYQSEQIFMWRNENVEKIPAMFWQTPFNSNIKLECRSFRKWTWKILPGKTNTSLWRKDRIFHRPCFHW